jgi:hypothetical protein
LILNGREEGRAALSRWDVKRLRPQTISQNFCEELKDSPTDEVDVLYFTRLSMELRLTMIIRWVPANKYNQGKEIARLRRFLHLIPGRACQGVLRMIMRSKVFYRGDRHGSYALQPARAMES